MKNGTSTIEHTFMVPFLTDGSDSEIILPNPAEPIRVHYFLSEQVNKTNDFFFYNEVDFSRPESVTETFERVDDPTRLIDTLELVACFSYLGYAPLSSMCNTDVRHSVINLKGSCFTDLEKA